MSQKTIKTGDLFRSTRFSREAVNAEDRTVELSFSSEEPYERYWGTEILDHKKKSVRLERLKRGAPLLLEHYGEQIGVIESVKIADGKGRAVVRFSKSARGEEILQDVADGIRQNVSVGYRIHKMVQEESDPDTPVFRATDWEPFEISIVAIPADTTVGVGRTSARDKIFETKIFIKEDSQMDPNKDQTRNQNGSPDTPAAEPTVDTAKVRQDAVASERRRINELTAIRGQYPHLAGDVDQAIANGTGVDEFRGLVWDKVGKVEALRAKDPNIGLTTAERRQYSFFRALRVLCFKDNPAFREDAAFELECSRAVEKVLKRTPEGLFIPHDVLGDGLNGQRTLTAGTATDGAELVADELKPSMFIDVLRNKLVVVGMGARLLTGLVGDVLIPRKTGGSAAGWVTPEGGDVSLSEAQFDQVSLTPKTLGAYSQISRQLLLQSSMDVENLVKDDLAWAVALAIQTAALYGTAASGQPRGITNQTGINTPTAFAAATPTWAEIIAMESAVAADNADIGNMGYLVEATMRGNLKTQPKVSGYPLFCWNDASPDSPLNGYKAGVTNAVVSGDVFFGNWADLLVGFWGGLDVLVDPYTGGLAGTLRIVVHESVDVAVRHPESFAHNNDGI